MRFTKMHGAGNDYVCVDLFRERVADPVTLARAVSDRHRGVGSDGLILIAPSRRADVLMIMFNADGSRAEMCGNGVRCVGKYAYEHGLARVREMDVETGAGIVHLSLHVEGGKVHEVTVDMGKPRPVPRAFYRRADGMEAVVPARVAGHEGWVLSMGNPHFVVPVASVDRAPVRVRGPVLERHADFPSRVNVEFVEVLSRVRFRQRTWERGSGETLACGTGACAAAAALFWAGRTGRRVRADLAGGTLRLEVGEDGGILMAGPAAEVFRGEWPTPRAGRR